MTTPDYLARCVLPAAYGLLPPEMQSPQASAMLLAIALQESGCVHRQQVNGPARGFWQFEVAGVTGVRQHAASHAHVQAILATLCYRATLPSRTIQAAIEHNDILACVFARLLLWTLPEALPERDDPDGAWKQYVGCWRPGRPHRERWESCYTYAWEIVAGEDS